MRRLAIALLLLLFVSACSGGSEKPKPKPATVSIDDPAGDCISVRNTAAPCEPASLDLRKFTVERDVSGNIIVTIEISPPGIEALGGHGVQIAIDTDRDRTTGARQFLPYHGMSPEIELDENSFGASKESLVRLYPADGGAPSLGDSTQVQWKQLDSTHIQATITNQLVTVDSFDIVVDLLVSDRYDHVPDNATLSFPDGKVIPR